MKCWMHEWHKRTGIDQLMLAHAAKISIDLVRMLEDSDVNITHPKIANRLASLMGASAAERDSLVAAQHAGKWRTGSGKPLTCAADVCARVPKPGKPGTRMIKQIDVNGDVLCVYDSAPAAYKATGDNVTFIHSRCARRVENEFKRGYTYRYMEDEL